MTIECDDFCITPSSNLRILGLKISKFGLTSQVTENVIKTKYRLGNLYRFSPLSTHLRRQLYISLVRSVLTYPVVPLHTLNKTNMLKLQRVQNKALRFILGRPRHYDESVANMHVIAKLPAVNEFMHRSARKIWSCMNNMVNIGPHPEIQI